MKSSINERDQLKSKERFILFMDILGSKETENEIAWLESVENLKEMNAKFEVSDDKFNFDFSSFSDHIVASCPIYDHDESENYIEHFLYSMFILASDLSRNSLIRGLPMRGVLTKGDLIHEENIIRGKEFVNAVKLEEKTAIYPRVILTRSILDFIKNMPRELSSPVPLVRDFDGLYYVDYFKEIPLYRFPANNNYTLFTRLDDYFNKFYIQIKDNLSNDEICENLHKLAKWQWLANKLDEAVDYWNERLDSDNQLEIQRFNIKNPAVLYDKDNVNSLYRIKLEL